MAHSTPLHQRVSVLADFLERHFKITKLLAAKLGECSFHLPGMRTKRGGKKALAACCKGNDPNASVLAAFDPANQALRDEAIDSDA